MFILLICRCKQNLDEKSFSTLSSHPFELQFAEHFAFSFSKNSKNTYPFSYWLQITSWLLLVLLLKRDSTSWHTYVLQNLQTCLHRKGLNAPLWGTTSKMKLTSSQYNSPTLWRWGEDENHQHITSFNEHPKREVVPISPQSIQGELSQAQGLLITS